MGYLFEQQYNAPMSTYVDPKLEILQGTLGALQQRHEEVQTKYDLLNQAAANMQSAPFKGDMLLKKQAFEEAAKAFDEASESGDFANLRGAISLASNNFNKKYTPIQRNLQQYNEWRKSLDEAYQKGEIGEFGYREALAKKDEYKGLDPDNIDGTYFNGHKPSKYYDITDEAYKRVEGWKPDTTLVAGGQEFTRTKDGQYLVVGTEKEVPFSEVFNALLRDFMYDPKYKGQLDDQANYLSRSKKFDETGKLIGENGELYKEVLTKMGLNTTGMTDADAYKTYEKLNAVQNAITGAAQKASFREIDPTWLQDNSLDNMLKMAKLKAIAQEQETSPTNSEGINRVVNVQKELDNYTFDSSGNIVSTDKVYVTDKGTNVTKQAVLEAADKHGVSSSQAEAYLNGKSPVFGKGGAPQGWDSFKKEIGNIKGTTTNKQDLEMKKAQINSYRQTFGLQGTDSEVVAKIKEANKSLSSESIPLESISNNASKDYAKAIVRNKMQRSFYIMDGKGTTTDDMTLNKVLDELGISEQEFDNQLLGKGDSDTEYSGAIGGISQGAATPGAVYAEIKGKNGESRRVFISNDEHSNFFTTSNLLNQARLSLKPTTVDLPGISYQVVPKIINGKYEHDYIVGETKDGIFVPDTDKKGQPVKTSLSDIRQRELQMFKSSGKLGSKLAITDKTETE